MPQTTVEEFIRSHLQLEQFKRFAVTHVFADNYIDEPSKRKLYPNFCFFGKKFHAQASNVKEVLNEEEREIFVLSISGGFRKISIQNYMNYDFRKASERSQLTVAFYLVDGESFFLNASGVNCDVLLDICSEYLIALR